MKVFSIDPHSGNYFEDNKEHLLSDAYMYQGTYNYTPVYPRYTFLNSCRFNYISNNNVIEFYTMLPVSRLFGKYLIEVRFRYIINVFDSCSLNRAIEEFNKFCEENKKTISIKGLLSQSKSSI